MADTFFHPIDVAISNDNSNPPDGFARLQIKSDGLLRLKVQGVEQIIGQGGTSGSPRIIDSGEVYTVEENQQVLFRKKIKIEEGGVLKLAGLLIEV